MSSFECCCCSNLTQNGKPEPQSMEGTLERKQKLQLGGKKVGFQFVLKPGNAQFLSQQLTLLSSFHRQPPEAGTPTMPSCTDTPCASMKTEKTHCGSAKHTHAHTGKADLLSQYEVIYNQPVLCCRTLQRACL